MTPTVETSNGAVDLSERGSAYSGERLFDYYDDGKVFAGQWDFYESRIDNMFDRDGKARALEQVLTLPLRSAPFAIKPADGDTGEAEWVREQLTLPANNGGMTTPLDLVIAQLASAVLYRRAFFEKVWKVTDDGRISFDKVAFRPARTCRLRRDKQTFSFQGFSQRFRRGDDIVTEDFKPDKALVYIHGQHRNPLDGISDLHTARNCFESKQKVRFLWYAFLENQVIPKAIATTIEGHEQAFAKNVATLKGGGVLGVTENQKVEAFESNGQGAAIFQEAMRYLDQEMFASCLAGFADLAGAASSGRGSFALSKDQSDFFLRSRQAVLGEMGSALTNFAIADLVRWNYGRAGRVPTFEFGELTGTDASDAIAAWQALATSATPSPQLPSEFIDLLTEKVAAHLDLDVDKVRKAIDAKTEGAATPGDALQGGIAAAAQLVAEAGLAPAAA